ncbi:MAG: MBL fold metallo-hydrolase, partial [Planctomycetaceae bacterium]
MKITFLGAAGEVTGSQHLIETDTRRILLDCGLFQGRRQECREKNEQFHCRPADLDGVILSHAHIDHSGNLPGLCKAGYKGPIFCTEATADIAYIMLRDSAKIQQEDAKYLRKRWRRENKGNEDKIPKIEPLYGEEDVRNLSKQLQPLNFSEWHQLADDFRVRFHNAGHILGSAIVEVELEDEGRTRRVVFSGDLGQRGMPLLRDPAQIDGCDVLICESTYGNRTHPPIANIRVHLERIVKRAIANDGRVVIPAFSLGRTQLVLHILNNMYNEGELGETPVFVDSPLATRLTDVYRDYQRELNDRVLEKLKTDDDVFEFPTLRFVQSRDESMKLNRRKGAFIVIASSGMCEFGRVVHHLKHAVSHEENEICIIGYQAAHTLGRRLVERRPVVRIFGREYKLRANVQKINGLSAHGDAEDLKWWISEISKRGGADNVFLVHGESDSAKALANVIRHDC